MIDDKEIDIAARAQALSKHLNETAYFQLRSIEDFTDGAKWMREEFLKNLWHPASEEPKFGKGRLFVLINGSVSILNVGFVLDQLRNLHNVYGIDGWLYLNDLLPKEGGEQ